MKPSKKARLTTERRIRESRDRALQCHIEVNGSAKHAFVHAERGRWIKTHIAAASIKCPHCQAAPGWACSGANGFNVKPHIVRINAYYTHLQAEVAAYHKKSRKKRA